MVYYFAFLICKNDTTADATEAKKNKIAPVWLTLTRENGALRALSISAAVVFTSPKGVTAVTSANDNQPIRPITAAKTAPQNTN